MKLRHRLFRVLLWFAAFGLLAAACLSISDGDNLQATLDAFCSAIMLLLLWFGRVPTAGESSKPRFSVKTMLLLIPVVFAVQWWWATWPGRTLQEFKRLVADGRTDAAASMVTFAPDYHMTPQSVAHQLSGQPHTILVRRNWLDLLLARQRYNVSGTALMCWVQDGSSFHHRVCAELKVERGKIKYEWGPTMAEYHSQERRNRGLPPLPYDHYRL